MALTTALSGIIGGSGSSKTGTTAGTSTSTYSPTQTGLQSSLASAFQDVLSSGGKSLAPVVKQAETGAADTINKTYSGLGDRMNRWLAGRGFGGAGVGGKTQLETELGRAGALGSNASTFAGKQLDLYSTSLSDALKYAFANPGSSYSATSTDKSGGGLAGALAAMLASANNGLQLAALGGD